MSEREPFKLSDEQLEALDIVLATDRAALVQQIEFLVNQDRASSPAPREQASLAEKLIAWDAKYPKRSKNWSEHYACGVREAIKAIEKLKLSGPMGSSVEAGEYRSGFNDMIDLVSKRGGQALWYTAWQLSIAEELRRKP